MVISLDTYRTNRELVKELYEISNYFAKKYPNKTWGWIGLTALVFAQVAIEEYIEDNTPREGFYPALKAMLWNFQNKVNELQNKKGGKQNG